MKNLKRIILLAGVVLLMVNIPSVLGLENNNAQIVFEGMDQSYKNDIYMENDMLYVPLRETFEMMNIPVEWDDTNQTAIVKMCNKKIESDDCKDGGVIPNAEIAYTVGKAILENYIGRDLEYENDIGKFYLKAEYRQNTQTWLISQECEFKNGGGGGTGFYSPSIVLDKNTAEVLYIYTQPHFAERTQIRRGRLETAEKVGILQNIRFADRGTVRDH